MLRRVAAASGRATRRLARRVAPWVALIGTLAARAARAVAARAALAVLFVGQAARVLWLRLAPTSRRLARSWAAAAARLRGLVADAGRGARARVPRLR
jgi:hypothetical protein